MSNYIEFLKKYEKKLKNDKEIAGRTREKDWMCDFTERITFYVSVDSHIPSATLDYRRSDKKLFALDAEDLEYFSRKYGYKACEEKKRKIEEINKEYEKYCGAD